MLFLQQLSFPERYFKERGFRVPVPGHLCRNKAKLPVRLWFEADPLHKTLLVHRSLLHCHGEQCEDLQVQILNRSPRLLLRRNSLCLLSLPSRVLLQHLRVLRLRSFDHEIHRHAVQAGFHPFSMPLRAEFFPAKRHLHHLRQELVLQRGQLYPLSRMPDMQQIRMHLLQLRHATDQLRLHMQQSESD